MSILNRHKKKQLEGFKEFVRSLESTSEKKRKEIVQLAILEDPLYMAFIVKNMITFEILLSISSEDVMLVVEKIPSGWDMLAKAFYKHEKESEFHQSLADNMKKFYEESKELVQGLTVGMQEGARFAIVKAVRDLEDEQKAFLATWKIPGPEVVNINSLHQRDGAVEIRYENETIGASGQVHKGSRYGTWIFHYPNGVKMAEGQYQNGERQGPWIFWWSNGNKKSEGLYKGDVKEGEWKQWDQSGNLLSA